MFDAVVQPVGNGTVHERAGKALANGFKQPGFARDVQKSLVLAGKAGGKQVFSGGRAAHRQRRLFAVFGAQAGIGRIDFRHHAGRQHRVVDDFARSAGAPGQVIDILHVQAVERLVQIGTGQLGGGRPRR